MDLEQRAPDKPQLVFFRSRASGRARRIDGFLANVLQRRRNHHTFRITRIDVEDQPQLAERFRVNGAPTLFVVEGKRVQARLENPAGTHEVEQFLRPWLRPARGRREP